MEKLEKVVHKVELVRMSVNRLNPEKIDKQMRYIVETSVNYANREKGWTINIENVDRRQVGAKEYMFRRNLVVTLTPRRARSEESINADWDGILRHVAAGAAKNKWTVQSIDGKMFSENDDRAPATVSYADLSMPKDWNSHFKVLYNRNQQVEIIRSAINAAVTSEWQQRFHCALIGPPACGKTQTLRCIKSAVGTDAVLEFDATTTTQAGAIAMLKDRAEQPRILLVEEIEKTEENSLRWLLAALDARAEINKKTYRDRIDLETKFLCLATVNKYPLFCSLMSGALASRFSWHLNYPRPTREELEMILGREVAQVKGDKRWIKPALDFAASLKITDPRKVTAICLCGRQDLLNGKYQKLLSVCNMED